METFTLKEYQEYEQELVSFNKIQSTSDELYLNDVNETFNSVSKKEIVNLFKMIDLAYSNHKTLEDDKPKTVKERIEQYEVMNCLKFTVDEVLEKVEPLTRYKVRDFLTFTPRTGLAYRALYNSAFWSLYQIWIFYVIKYGEFKNMRKIWNAVYYCDRNNPDYGTDLFYACKYGIKDKFCYALYSFNFSNTLNGVPMINCDDLITLCRENKHNKNNEFEDILNKMGEIEDNNNLHTSINYPQNTREKEELGDDNYDIAYKKWTTELMDYLECFF